MTGEEPTGDDRTCGSCGQPLPRGRSVCPSCGTLQRARVEPDPPDNPADSGSDVASGAAPVDPPSEHAPVETGPGRRLSRTSLVMIIGAIVCVAGVAAGARFLDQRDAEDTAATTTTAARGTDPRARAIRGFCDDPRPLTRPADIAAFTPGQATLAHIEVPRPASSTEAPGEITVQVSPAVGSPDLELDPSVGLVSLAVCLDPSGSRTTKGTCDYELTNAASIGERARAKLVETTYDVQLVELRTGKALAEGKLTTPVDRCPDQAFVVEGEGVSNSLADEQILAWISVNLVDGRPA